MNHIEARDLVKRFGKVSALNGLSLTVPTGSVFGLVGPNGAGKTTTLRIALGLLRPDGGSIAVLSEDPWENVRVRMELGVLHEKPVYPGDMSCRRFLRHVARIYGVGDAEKNMKRVLTLVGLEAASERRIKGLSAGMLQRLGIAQALIHEPPLIITDEPASNLDPIGRTELLDLVTALHKDHGVDFLISSHILPELSKVCDRLAIIDRGKVHAEGPLDDLLRRYKLNVYKVTSSDPKLMASALLKLQYVEQASVEADGALIKIREGHEKDLYRDVGEIAEEIDVTLYGVEARVTNLEELYRKVVKERG